MSKQSPWNHHRIFTAPQKTPEGGGILSSAKYALFVVRDCHPFHHVMTIKTPRSNARFPQNAPKMEESRSCGYAIFFCNKEVKYQPRIARTSPTTSSTVIEVKHLFRSTTHVSSPHPQQSVLW
jgi:hypothetical protein